MRSVVRGWLMAVAIVAFDTGVRAEPGSPVKPQNHLAGESSPYLLQHVHNPVDWYPWGAAAFEKAKTERKLIFLSIGYSTCHWCHVMERESFSNDEIARLLNEHFVCIKVDREERPDVDQLYMTALQVMGQDGGWPLTMFLTADAKPIVGGTYWPPADREVDGERIPGLPTILQAIIDARAKTPETLQQTADLRANQTRRALALHQGLLRKVEPSRELVAAVVAEIAGMADPVHGGFGRPPEFAGAKFPQPASLKLLQTVCATLPDSPQQTILDKTLTEMARGGIYDQLGGGFHRYSTDRAWRIPHFEKMLYDNGQLLEIYAHEFARTPNPLYEQVLRETAAFVERELTSPQGAFWTALDADSEGAEGRYYVWNEAQLRLALPDEADRERARQLFDLDVGPDDEDGSGVLRLPANLTAAELDQRRVLSQRLLAARQSRTRPTTDTKILTAWNGLMIAGLARAGQSLNDETLIRQAARAAEFLLEQQSTPERLLYHLSASATGEELKPRGSGYLDDYTHFVHGLLALHTATGDERWLRAAQRLTAVMIEQFHDREHGGFYYTSQGHEELFYRMKDQHDGVMPSGNSQAAINLLVLAKRTGDQRYRELARTTIATFAPVMEQAPAGMATMAEALLVELTGDRAEAKSK